MSPLPRYMANRWENRSEPAPGQGVLYWHVLLGANPEVQAIAAAGRAKLVSFSGLHFTPKQYLHVTTLVAGPVDEFSDSGIKNMIEDATRLLSEIRPVTVRLDSVIYHPEAIVLRVRPDSVLDPIYAAVRAATGIASDRGQPTEHQLWSPHVTLAYSTSAQEAGPIIKALGLKLPVCEVVIDRINLVIQKGPERLWNWHSIAEIEFNKAEW